MNKNRLHTAMQLAAIVPLALLAGCMLPGSKVADSNPAHLEPLPQGTAMQSPAVAETRDSFQQASFQQAGESSDNEILLQPLPATTAPTLAEQLPGEPLIRSGTYPIDLANALGLGGADNLQVRLARTRLFQAQAKHFQAKTLWLPSLRLGVGYNKHDGQLQETVGNVIEVERNSLFYGGGLGLGSAPLNAGAGGPPRMFVDLSLADAWFKPLAACQVVAAHGAAERVATNDSLAEIAINYQNLVEAHGMHANASSARDLAQDMVSTVENFEREGFSSKTEVNRARTALAKWQREVAEAQRQTVAHSSELARILRLPPQVQLVPVEEYVMPFDFVDTSAETETLISIAWNSRPEISEQAALREAACFRVQEEKWRPWIPNVHAGASGGGFGGGVSTDFPSASSRSDVDLLAVWEWENLGLGNVALQRQRRGELHERSLELEVVRERIAAEVVAAVADINSYRTQMQLAQESIVAAQESYTLNKQRIRAGEGLPIELLQSISALAESQIAYTSAVANFNRAQYRLLRAMGSPAGVPAENMESLPEVAAQASYPPPPTDQGQTL